MSAADEIILLREAYKGEKSAGQLCKELSLPIGKKRVQQILRGTSTLSYEKFKRAPMLTKEHKENRINWSTAFVSRTDAEWRKIVFSDEKKFNLDGPDGLNYYWHDLRREERVLFRRQNGGGSVMIWACFSYYDKSKIAFLSGRQKSEDYCKTLQEVLLEFAAVNHGVDWEFQQDNAPIHTSQVTKAWFNENNLHVIDWPARSPDLNPIENLWGILARAVYINGKQYESVTSLKSAITYEWSKINETVLQGLVSSMRNRCVEVLKNKGGKVNY